MTQEQPTTPEMVIRNEQFALSDDVNYCWHSDCPGISNWFNALSLLFPAGETFFMDSARPHLKNITDPKLRAEARMFMTQEAIHTREHVAYNEMLERSGLPGKYGEQRIYQELEKVKNWLDEDEQLGLTVALEHWTAVFADNILKNPAYMKGAHPEMARLWRWHSIEETEHKAVCFDIMEQSFDDKEKFNKIRKGRFTQEMFGFHLTVMIIWFQLMKHSGHRWNLKAWGRTIWFLWGKPGLLRKSVKQWRDFYRDDFHPWDHDNRDLIADYDAQRAEAIPAE